MAWRLVLWASAASLLASVRVPFDDEWLSIELAFESTPAQFWFALEHDLHPPWIALLDRALGQVWLAIALRIALSALAIACAARGLAQALAVPRTWLPWAALQPIALLYAGSLRWYAFLWLAQALRASALWQPRAAGRTRDAAFVAGAWLGAIASYVDALFVLHDALWWLAHARAERRMRSALGAVALALLGMIALRVASPLHVGLHAALWQGWPVFEPRALAQWFGLGVAGEAALPSPYWLAGVTCGVAALWAIVVSLRAAETRAASAWLVMTGGVWVIACGYGIWHPRYSLLVWSILPALVAARWSSAKLGMRCVIGLATAHLAIGLGLCATGHGFFKADLNGLNASDCAPLTAAQPRTILVSYARLPRLFARCVPTANFVRAPSVLLEPDPGRRLARVVPWLARGREVWLLTSHVNSSFADGDQQLRAAALAHGCEPLGSEDFGRIPHPGLTAQRPTDYRRFRLEHFACGR